MQDNDSGSGVATPEAPAGAPSRLGRKISTGMLIVGAALVWPVPLGGALFLVTAGFGLAICSEAGLDGRAVDVA